MEKEVAGLSVFYFKLVISPVGIKRIFSRTVADKLPENVRIINKLLVAVTTAFTESSAVADVMSR